MTSNGVEKWMMPCGKRIDHSPPHASNEVRSSDAELLSMIIDQSKRSYLIANDFKERFAKNTFNMDWDQLHNLYKSHQSYEWLPSIPKKLGESASHAHLSSLQLDETLQDTYEHLQRIAVGMDQIVIDEKSRSRTMTKDFEEMEKYVMSILCEIQTTMLERKISGKPDIERSIMPDFLKNGDNTQKNVRNYMILRDYINILEYVIACFEHLKRKL